jgi:hypothetical protein
MTGLWVKMLCTLLWGLPPTRLHDVIIQNTIVQIFSTQKISNLITFGIIMTMYSSICQSVTPSAYLLNQLMDFMEVCINIMQLRDHFTFVILNLPINNTNMATINMSEVEPTLNVGPSNLRVAPLKNTSFSEFIFLKT